MKTIKTIIAWILFNVFCVTSAMAATISTEPDVYRLKNDLLNDVVQIGRTRLKELRRNYGDAPNITDEDDKVVYEYDDLKIEFDKVQYWVDWGYDGFKSKAYTRDIDALREDLTSEKLIGSNITYKYILREYGLPTESNPATNDGGISHYYYGDIRMTFENVFILKKWRGKNLTQKVDPGVLGGS